MAQEQEDESSPKGFWTSLPGILTGIGGILSAATALYIAVFGGPRTPPAATNNAVVAPAPEKKDDTDKKQQAAAVDRFDIIAVIDDPDGFTNVRSGRSASSPVVAKVTRHEQFFTYKQKGDWWEVRTRDGITGYMHASRIRVLTK